MPFTPAHPAIILPLINKKYFSATGLIVGSVSPDFEYFFRASVHGVHGHTLAGIIYFDLPVALFFSFVFHLLIKSSLISNLPYFLQVRLRPLQELDFKSYLTSHLFVFSISAIVGAFSHIFWDSFTHRGRFFVEILPVYKNAYVPFQGVKYPLWYALQHISTFTGLAIIMIYIFFLPTDNSANLSSPKLLYWISLITLSSLFFVVRFTFLSGDYNLGNAVVTGISSLLLSACLISSITYFKASHITH